VGGDKKNFLLLFSRFVVSKDSHHRRGLGDDVIGGRYLIFVEFTSVL
jgi:hypothetical protein